MAEIELSHLTKDYGHNRGVFDVSIKVEQGECFGFLGPNGAGKTTSIRHLMGFSKPQQGQASIRDKECWKHSAELLRNVGYLPGEISLPTDMHGMTFLHMMERMRGIRDDKHLKQLLDTFELDPNISTRNMSLGVKRKLAVVVAFMHDPDILILDEPTSGLDPISQQTFIDYVQQEKSRGKTIFLSSHLFNEVDATCDRVAIIREGHIVSQFELEEFHQRGDRFYQISFDKSENYAAFAALPYEFSLQSPVRKCVQIHINDSQINQLIADVARTEATEFSEIPFTLESYFMQFYEDDSEFEEVK